MGVDEVLSRARSGMNVAIPALAETVGLSRGGLYQAVKRGDVESVKIGRALFVPAHEARRLLGIKPNSSDYEAPSA